MRLRRTLSMYVVDVCMYIYINQKDLLVVEGTCVCVYIYIYIYISKVRQVGDHI